MPQLLSASNDAADYHAFGYSDASLELGLWRTILPFGSEKNPAPTYRAFYEFDQALTTFSAVHRAAHINLQDRTQLLTLRDEVIDLDVEALVLVKRDYLHQKNAHSSTLSFWGDWVDSGDWLDSGDYQIYLGQSPAHRTSSKMGQLELDLTIEEGSLSKDSAILSTVLTVNMGTVLFQEMLQSWEVFHKEIEQQSNLAGLVVEPALMGIIFSRPQFDKRDEKIIDVVNESAPTVLSLIQRVMSIDNIVDTPLEHEGRTMTQINVLHTLDVDALKTHYEAAYDQYGPMIEHLSFSTRFVTAQGQLIAIVHYDAETKVFGFKLTVSDGGIVLMNPDGTLTSEVIYPSQLRALEYVVKNDIFVDVFGLKVTIDRVDLNARYVRTQPTISPSNITPSNLTQSTSSDRSRVRMVLNQLPEIKVEGALLHVVPPWLINALIPGTIESNIKDAFAEAVNGRDGEGALLQFVFDQKNGLHELSAELNVEVPYRLLQDVASGFGRQLIQSRVRTQQGDHHRVLAVQPKPLFFKDLGEAVRLDFERLLRNYNYHTAGMVKSSSVTQLR